MYVACRFGKVSYPRTAMLHGVIPSSFAALVFGTLALIGSPKVTLVKSWSARNARGWVARF